MISAMAVPSFMAVPSPKLADVGLGLVRHSWNRNSSIGKACAPPLQGSSDMHPDDPANMGPAPDARLLLRASVPAPLTPQPVNCGQGSEADCARQLTCDAVALQQRSDQAEK